MSKYSEMVKQLADISYFIMEAYSDKEPLNENQRDSRNCFMKYCKNIKQALLKAQEQEKVLEIMFEKNVDIALLKECKNKSEYNIEVQCHNENLMKPLEWWTRGKLTEEEFDFIKKRC